ncbi:MAG TPA: HAMP domain-containing protein, partial [Dehalococcoidia bacterium]|nr:HAMP domain-containing protein [Dehalococcoidia bacterium]
MRSLRTKTILWALLPIALVLAIAAVTTLYAYERVMRDVVQEWETELAGTLAARLSEGMNQHSLVLQTIAQENDVRSMEPDRVRQAMQHDESRLTTFDAGVIVYDSHGAPVWSTIAGTEYFDTGFPMLDTIKLLRNSRRPVFSDVFKEITSGKDVVLIAVAVTQDDGSFAGVMVGMSEVKHPVPGAIYARVVNLQVGESGFAYLVDGNGRVIYHPFSSFMGARLTATEPVSRVLKGDTGAILTEDLSGARVISGFAPVAGTNWGLIIEEQWLSVIGPVRGYNSLLIVLLVTAGVLSVVLVGLSTGRILKPIRDLTNGARRIAGGDFDHTITAQTGDEVQVLAEQFNNMAGALKESYTDLERKVEERTRGERRRADQLRTINEVGRRISSILSLDELISYVVTSLHDTFKYYRVIFLLPEPESGELVFKASNIEPTLVPEQNTTRIKITDGITGWVFRNGEPLMINDVSKEPRY